VAELLREWGVFTVELSSVADGVAAQKADVLLVDVRTADFEALWGTVTTRPVEGTRTTLLVPPQADALRLSGDVAGTISLPIREAQLFDALVGRVDKAAAEPLAVPIDAHVLVVDDAAINREVIKEMLRQVGCSVEVAVSGTDAIDRCAAERYDLVLMDCHMPNLDGFEATAAIRSADGPNRATPIVALTASVLAHERERCFAVGMNEYMTKPIGRADLVTCLRRHVPLARVDGDTDAPAALPATTALPVFDAEATLDRIGGNTKLLIRLIALFQRDAVPLLDKMRDELDRGDADELRTTAHKLKGSLRSLGGQSAQSIAQELERLAATGELGGAVSVLEALDDEIGRLRQALNDFDAGADPDAES